jgi:hypothetical protein
MQPPLLDSSFPIPVDQPFSLAQALATGLTRHRLRTLVDQDLVRRVLVGAYIAAQVPDSLLLRAQALALVVPSGAVVTDWSACWIHIGLLPPGQHLEVPRLSVFRPAGGNRLRNRLCTSGERSFDPEDLMGIGGLTVTTALRTAFDIGRLGRRDHVLGAFDALVRSGAFPVSALTGGVERFAGRRGVVQLRELAPLTDPRSESPRESLLRLRWLDLPSLPRPTPQLPVTVGGVEVYRVDLGVPELRYGCEYDGERFHGDDARESDRQRREDLRIRFRWDVDVVRAANVTGPRRDVEAILIEGVARARRALGNPTYAA